MDQGGRAVEYNMVRYGAGILCCGAVLCGAVCCGAVLCGAVQCGVVRCAVAGIRMRNGTEWCRLVQFQCGLVL